jgi:hypothetical protein
MKIINELKRLEQTASSQAIYRTAKGLRILLEKENENVIIY